MGETFLQGVCDVPYIPSQRPTQTPNTEQNSKEIPLSCCLTRWTSVIVAEFPPRHWSHMRAHTHTHIHQECQCNTNRTKHRGIPLFVVMTLFTRWRLGYENEKCGWITFAAFLKHLWNKTLWILFLYDSKFLFMSHRKHTQQQSTAAWQTRLLHINMHQQTQFTRQLYHPSFKWAARHFCSTNTFFTKMKRRSRLCLFISEALLVRISLEVESKWTQANCLWSITLPLPSAGVFLPTLAKQHFLKVQYVRTGHTSNSTPSTLLRY